MHQTGPMPLLTLRHWLASLDSTQLEIVLERTRASEVGHRVRNLDDLAQHLSQPYVVYQVMQTVPTPVLELVEAVSALGGGPTTSRVTSLLGHGDPDQRSQEVAAWVGVASAGALLWLDADRIRLNPAIDRILVEPFALARPSRAILPSLTVDVLRGTLRTAGINPPTRKADMITAVEGVFADAGAVRRIAAQAPAGVLNRLSAHVTSRLATAQSIANAMHDDAGDEYPMRSPDDYTAMRELVTWSVENGLAFGYAGWGYGGTAEFPAEVYLALATPEFRLPFSPLAPELTTVAVLDEQLARSSAAAVSEFLGTAMAVLEATRSGVATLKNGGIGARELTRFAKQVGTDVPTIRLVLHLGAALGLLEQVDSKIRASEDFQDWRHDTPAQRAASLCDSWLRLTCAPTLERGHDGKYLAVFGRDTPGYDIPLTFTMCHLLSTYPGAGALHGQQVLDQIAWAHPFETIGPNGGLQTWAEAHQLGMLAEGALAPFARKLVQRDIDGAIELLAEILPQSSGQVLFGSDLTIVIPGSPAPDAVDLLDIVATRESHGVVGSWRVTADSVRSSLDSGYTVEHLLPALRALTDQPLPQTLEYLLKDVARKHGHLGVRGASAVITAEDPALLAEVVASRQLRGLALSLVTPTVALAASPPDATLTALRAAGYLPVEVDNDGGPVVQLRHLPDRSEGPGGITRRSVEIIPSSEGPDDEYGGHGPGHHDLLDYDLQDGDPEDDALLDAEIAAFLAKNGSAAPGLRAAPFDVPGGASQMPRDPETAAELARRLLDG